MFFFSVNNNKIYPLRLNKKDCQKSIDLFLFEKDGKSHYGLIKKLFKIGEVSNYFRHK